MKMATSRNLDLLALLQGMAAAQASDLHLVPGHPPMYRVHGELKPAAECAIPSGSVLSLLESVAPEETRQSPGARTDVDFALAPPGREHPLRFRVNVFSARGDHGACFRAIPEHIPSLGELGFPAELAERVTAYKSGLVLLTGITGSGKTTSLAALIQIINSRGGCRIITVEEPIEYVYPICAASVVTQREVGRDVASFYDGLRFGLRQDPDVILVGEIRDRETAQLALSAAETGHLIFATLHTADAKGAVTRLVDLFPPEQHDDIRTQLSLSLRCVIAQHLLPATEGGRRVLATEVMTANFPVRSAIRMGKIESLDSAMQSGRKDGMWSLDADLRRLMMEGRISIETARDYAKDPSEFGK
ncbi:MAG: type IV pili twitching motility protein PilT [Planctomycetota bacterium]|nr:MAG: type IV pili twitching motility protein PilT [Planctomycetota bacterium]